MAWKGIQGPHRGRYVGPSAGLDRDAGQSGRSRAGRGAGRAGAGGDRGTVELAYVDQGYPGPNAQEAAEQHGLRLEVVKHPMAKRGFVLLPRRWVVERSSAWAHASAASPGTTNDSTCSPSQTLC